jgi:DNA repair exonuclease SbcCD nuclease subunit
VKIVHAADLHLDSPLRGLQRYEGAPVERLRNATRRAFSNLVQLCLDENAQLLLIAGDVHDDDWNDYTTGLFFAAELARLRACGTQVVWIRGNHDAASKITKKLKLPEGWVFELPHQRPGTRVFEDLGVAVHGQSFAKAAVSDNLAAHYPAPLAGLLNIGLLHTCIDGREGHAKYAPCRVEQLGSAGYDYWALGHVHAREVVLKDPWIVYPGNLQGRHARETGPKGASLITIEGGRVTQVDHQVLDVVRWVRCEVDAARVRTAEDVVDAVQADLEAAAEMADGRLLAARVTLTGATDAHFELARDADRWLHEVRQLSSLISCGEVWVEKVEVSTRPRIDVDALKRRDDVVGELARAFVEISADAEELARLAAEVAPVWQKLPAELRRDLPALDDPSVMRALLRDVEAAILPRVVHEEER